MSDRAVHLLTLPLGPTRTVNATLIAGDPLTLVDTGIRDAASLAAIERGLGELGLGIADLDQIAITHPHNDHFGAAGELVRRSGARLIGDGAAEMAGFPETFLPNTRFRIGLFGESGGPASLGDFWRERFAVLAGTGEPVTAAPLVSGDTLRAGGREWRVIATPGHAASSICLFEPREGTLISGDILLGNGASNVTLYATERPGRWILDIDASLRTLEALTPRVAYPGHGDLIADAAHTLSERRSAIRYRLDQVAGLVADAPMSSWDVSRRIYRPAIGETALGVSQAIGFLEALVATGRASSSCLDGVRRYRAA